MIYFLVFIHNLYIYSGFILFMTLSDINMLICWMLQDKFITFYWIDLLNFNTIAKPVKIWETDFIKW